MYKILAKQTLSHSVKRIKIEAPDIAKAALPGQFLVLMTDTEGERIPLTIAGRDTQKGTIDIIFQEVGYTTKKLGSMPEGRELNALLGPLGRPTEIKKYGTVACIGGGVGIAEILPVAEAMKQKGNRVLGIIGARAKDLLILEDEIRKACDETYVTTDDGSYEKKGLVTDVLKQLLKAAVPIDLVYTVGPVVMMAEVAKATRPFRIKTCCSLNPIMVDATGMCGSCRCTVEGRTKFACVDGPEFDAHQVDFAELQKRLRLFKKQESNKDAAYGA